MGFLDMGTLEIVLILVVALILLGPEKVPGIARTLGKTLRNLRKATTDFTATITRELDIEEEKKQLPPSKRNTGNKTKEPANDTASEDEATAEPDER